MSATLAITRFQSARSPAWSTHDLTSWQFPLPSWKRPRNSAGFGQRTGAQCGATTHHAEALAGLRLERLGVVGVMMHGPGWGPRSRFEGQAIGQGSNGCRIR
jgi:hypothetical protein